MESKLLFIWLSSCYFTIVTMLGSGKFCIQEPEKIPETVLTPEEQKMVNDFAAQIDITNTQMILQYGAGCHG